MIAKTTIWTDASNVLERTGNDITIKDDHGTASEPLGDLSGSTISDTPRTDPYRGRWATHERYDKTIFDHACDLERENARLSDEYDESQNQYAHQILENDRLKYENARLRDALKDVLADEWRVCCDYGPYPERAEILKRAEDILSNGTDEGQLGKQASTTKKGK